MSRSVRQCGTRSAIRAGEIRSASTPHAWAEVIRRCSSCIRWAERATSIPPQGVSTPSSVYWRTESRGRSVISLEWSTGKTKLEAWPVDPPGSGRGPLSTRTMSRQPSSARCRTRELPTTPAPMTTMSARSGTCAMASSRTAGLIRSRYIRMGALAMPRSIIPGVEDALAGLTVLVPPGVSVDSLSALAYVQIRDLIVTLQLSPGARLDEAELMDRLQLGRTPVREALRRLADEGLVTIYARRGTVVAPVDVRDLARVSEVRAVIQGDRKSTRLNSSHVAISYAVFGLKKKMH